MSSINVVINDNRKAFVKDLLEKISQEVQEKFEIQWFDCGEDFFNHLHSNNMPGIVVVEDCIPLLKVMKNRRDPRTGLNVLDSVIKRGNGNTKTILITTLQNYEKTYKTYMDMDPEGLVIIAESENKEFDEVFHQVMARLKKEMN